MLRPIRLMNPYHDKRGRFSSKTGLLLPMSYHETVSQAFRKVLNNLVGNELVDGIDADIGIRFPDEAQILKDFNDSTDAKKLLGYAESFWRSPRQRYISITPKGAAYMVSGNPEVQAIGDFILGHEAIHLRRRTGGKGLTSEALDNLHGLYNGIGRIEEGATEILAGATTESFRKAQIGSLNMRLKNSPYKGNQLLVAQMAADMAGGWKKTHVEDWLQAVSHIHKSLDQPDEVLKWLSDNYNTVTPKLHLETVGKVKTVSGQSLSDAADFSRQMKIITESLSNGEHPLENTSQLFQIQQMHKNLSAYIENRNYLGKNEAYNAWKLDELTVDETEKAIEAYWAAEMAKTRIYEDMTEKEWQRLHKKP